MEIIAQSKSVRISPRKIRLVADSIRNLSVQNTVNALSLIRKRGAYPLLKTLKSAMANAANNSNIKSENLFVKRIEVSEGSALKRYHPSTRGRIHPYKKRSSHVRIVLEERSRESV